MIQVLSAYEEVCVVDGSIIRNEKNLTIVAIKFKIKKIGKLVCTALRVNCSLPLEQK